MRFLLSLASIALLVCLFQLPSVTGAPAFYDPKIVQSFTGATLREAIKKDNQVVLINFYTPRNDKSREFAPQYTTVAKQLGNYAVVGAVNCKDEAEFCAKHDAADGTPVVKIFLNKKVFTYKDSTYKSKEVSEWAWKVYPNHVTTLTAASEKKKPRDKKLARVLLFTEKRETSPLYKSLALSMRQYASQVVFTEIRKQERKLLDHYGIGKTFPVLLVEPPVKEGEDERSARRYDGKMEQPLLSKFILSFLDGVPQGDASSTEGGAEASAATAASKAAAIPEIFDQSCLEKHCGGPLCIVLFLSKDHPDFAKHSQSFLSMETAAKSSKTVGKFNFVRFDSTNQTNDAANWMQNNFDLQVQDYPQLILLSVRKARFASYVGSFQQEGVMEFLEGVTKGRVKTIPFTTADKKLTALPNSNSCPVDAPKKEEKKPAASSTPAEPIKEEGELITLTPKNHDDDVLKHARPWVLLFHAGESHTSAEGPYKNLTVDFERVAKNMKDMIMFGRIDVEKHPELAAHWSVEVESVKTAPVIYSLPHRADRKVVDELTKFEGDYADVKAIRSFALERLNPAKVLIVTSQSMQQFMGDIQPNMPFSPKFIMFVKPAADGTVVVPDMLKALAIEFGGKAADGAMTFGAASSRERDLARQFNVTKIPSAFIMGQAEDMPGQESNQIRVAANQYGGNIIYSELQLFCEQTQRAYLQQKINWLARANATPKRSSSSSSSQKSSSSSSSKKEQPSKKGYTPPPREEDDEHVDLDSHEDL